MDTEDNGDDGGDSGGDMCGTGGWPSTTVGGYSWYGDVKRTKWYARLNRRKATCFVKTGLYTVVARRVFLLSTTRQHVQARLYFKKSGNLSPSRGVDNTKKDLERMKTEIYQVYDCEYLCETNTVKRKISR